MGVRRRSTLTYQEGDGRHGQNVLPSTTATALVASKASLSRSTTRLASLERSMSSLEAQMSRLKERFRRAAWAA